MALSRFGVGFFPRLLLDALSAPSCAQSLQRNNRCRRPSVAGYLRREWLHRQGWLWLRRAAGRARLAARALYAKLAHRETTRWMGGNIAQATGTSLGSCTNTTQAAKAAASLPAAGTAGLFCSHDRQGRAGRQAGNQAKSHRRALFFFFLFFPFPSLVRPRVPPPRRQADPGGSHPHMAAVVPLSQGVPAA